MELVQRWSLLPNLLTPPISRKMLVRRKQGEFNENVDPDHYATVFLGLIEGGIMQMKIYNKSRFLTDCLLHMERLGENLTKM